MKFDYETLSRGWKCRQEAYNGRCLYPAVDRLNMMIKLNITEIGCICCTLICKYRTYSGLEFINPTYVTQEPLKDCYITNNAE